MAALCYVQTERLLGTKSRVLRAGVYVNGSYYSEASGYSIFSGVVLINFPDGYKAILEEGQSNAEQEIFLD